MRKIRALTLVGIAALIAAVLPAAAAEDWGTWTFGGHGKSWHGTFVDSHEVTGFVIGLRSLKKYNSVTAFSIGGTKCKIGSIGTGYCYDVDVQPNTTLNWTLTTRKNVNRSKLISPCIKYNGKYHCRYGDG